MRSLGWAMLGPRAELTVSLPGGGNRYDISPPPQDMTEMPQASDQGWGWIRAERGPGGYGAQRNSQRWEEARRVGSQNLKRSMLKKLGVNKRWMWSSSSVEWAGPTEQDLPCFSDACHCILLDDVASNRTFAGLSFLRISESREY